MAYYGLCEKFEEAKRQAWERGWEKGWAEGWEKSWNMVLDVIEEKARKEGMAKSILFLLENIGDVPDPLREHIMQEKKKDTLASWLMIAAGSESIEEFRESASL